MGNLAVTAPSVDVLQNKIITLTTAVESSNKKIQLMKQRRKEDIMHFKDKLASKEDDFQTLSDQCETMEQAFQKKSKDLTAMKERYESTVGDLLAQLKEEEARRQKAETYVKEVLAQKERELTALKDTIERMNQDFERASKLHDEDIRSLTHSLEDMEKCTEHISKKMVAQDSQIREYKLQNENMSSSLVDLNSTIESIKSDKFVDSFMEKHDVPLLDNKYERGMYKALLNTVHYKLTNLHDQDID